MDHAGVDWLISKGLYAGGNVLATSLMANGQYAGGNVLGTGLPAGTTVVGKT